MTKEQFIEKYNGKAVWCKTEELAEEFLKECKNLKLIKKDYNLVRKNIIYILGDKAVNKSIGIMPYDTKNNIKNSNECFKDIDVEIIEYKPLALYEQVLELLGLKVGDIIKHKNTKKLFMVNANGINDRNVFSQFGYEVLSKLIYGFTNEYEILPPKPKLTEMKK